MVGIKSDADSEAAETMTGKIAHQQDISNVDFSSSAFDSIGRERIVARGDR